MPQVHRPPSIQMREEQCCFRQPWDPSACGGRQPAASACCKFISGTTDALAGKHTNEVICQTTLHHFITDPAKSNLILDRLSLRSSYVVSGNLGTRQPAACSLRLRLPAAVCAVRACRGPCTELLSFKVQIAAQDHPSSAVVQQLRWMVNGGSPRS